MKNIPFKEIDEFYGTSLSTILSKESTVIKKYDGTIQRGFEKLENEKDWLEQIPKIFHEKYPKSIPKVVDVIDEIPELFELHIEYINRKSLTKEILKGVVNSDQAKYFLRKSIELLIGNIYPLRSSKMNGYSIFQTFHYSRFQFANHHLRQIPWIKRILTSNEIVVNGIKCPTFQTVINHIKGNVTKYFKESKLVAFHGNLHLDNILVELNKGEPSGISLIDPRGELLGPPHYDFSKLLLTLEGCYDEVSYGGFIINDICTKDKFTISFNLNKQRDSIYSDCYSLALEMIPKFAKAENISSEQFYISSLASQWFHVFSFLFYHYNKEPNNKNKIYTFLGILGLLGKRILNNSKFKNDSVTISRIDLNEKL